MRNTFNASRPTADVIRNIGKIHRQEVRFIIEPCGPTKFRVKQIFPVTSKPGTIYTVSIGNAQLCTCGSHDICIHILYVLIRYFGVPKNSELLYQRTLSDREIESLLEGHYIGYSRAHGSRHQQQQTQIRSHQESGPTPTREYFYQPIAQPSSALSYITERFLTKPKVARLKISPGDLCPICYDSLSECSISEIAWCSHGCGGNFHVKCVQEWIDTRNASGEHGSCPLCRVPIDDPDTSSAPNQQDFENSFKECQEHPCDSTCPCIHSQDTCCSNNQNIAHQNNAENAPEQENNAASQLQMDNNSSYLAKLRGEMEENEKSNVQEIEQMPYFNHEESIDEYRLSANSLSSQLEEIENFLSTARNQLREHQRRVQAYVDAQVRANAINRSTLRDARGRAVEPVLKLKVPVFDTSATSTSNQPIQTVGSKKRINQTSPNNPQQVLPRMIESSTITGINQDHSNALSNRDEPQRSRVVSVLSPQSATRVVNRKEVAPPSSTSISIRTSQSSPVSIQSFSNNTQFDQIDSNENSNSLVNNEINSPIHNEIQSYSNDEIVSQKTISLVERLQQQNKPPKMIAHPSIAFSASSNSSTAKASHFMTPFNTGENQNQYTSNERPSTSLLLKPNENNNRHYTQRKSLSSLSAVKESDSQNEMPTKTSNRSKIEPKTINMNDILNSTIYGNITDGLTLAQMQARENEIRLQRTLSPGLNSIGSQKRASKSRLQPRQIKAETNAKRRQLQSYAGWSS